MKTRSFIRLASTPGGCSKPLLDEKDAFIEILE